MTTVKLTAHVDYQNRLTAMVPDSVPKGNVEILLLLPDEDPDVWMAGIAREWAEDFSDPAQDIYTLEDGKPVDAAE